MLYKSGSEWIPVKATTEYPVLRDAWSEINFAPVKTQALRLRFKLNKDFSAGIHEWVVN